MSPKPAVSTILFTSPRSPFGRRIRLALARLRIPHELRLVDTFAPTAEFLQANPLGMVPVLLDVATGVSHPDSNTILEVLHLRSGGGIWPADTNAQLAVRRQSTLATGLMTSTVALFLERSRESQDESWLSDHRESLHRTMAQLAEERAQSAPPPHVTGFTQADWDLAVALEYLDLRNPQWNWRAAHPHLEGWIRSASAAPEFVETRPPPPA